MARELSYPVKYAQTKTFSVTSNFRNVETLYFPEENKTDNIAFLIMFT